MWSEALKNKDSIGLITAHEEGENNMLRHLNLKHMIRIRKNDFVEFRGGLYTKLKEDFAPIHQVEAAIIYGMTKKTLMRLARRLGQEVVQYCDNSPEREFHLLSVNDYYENPQDCSLMVYKRELNDQTSVLKKKGFAGFFPDPCEKGGGVRHEAHPVSRTGRSCAPLAPLQ